MCVHAEFPSGEGERPVLNYCRAKTTPVALMIERRRNHLGRILGKLDMIRAG